MKGKTPAERKNKNHLIDSSGIPASLSYAGGGGGERQIFFCQTAHEV